MYCSREYQPSTRFIQQYEKSTSSSKVTFVNSELHDKLEQMDKDDEDILMTNLNN